MADNGSGVDKVTNTFVGLIDWGKEKVDQVFNFFGLYTTQYSKLIIYGVLLYLLGKMLKIRISK